MPGLWTAHVRQWLPPLVLTVVGLALLIVYLGFYSGRVEARVERVDETEAELGQLAARRAELEAHLAVVEGSRSQIEAFYGERLGTEAERLTAMIAEIKRLAQTAGLSPSTISYDRKEVEEHSLVKRSIVFAVSGNYLALRRLINLLELSDFFLTLEQVSLSEGSGGGAVLRINLRISSYFVDAERRAAAGARRAAG